MKTIALIVLLFSLAFTCHAQSTCVMNKDSSITMRPAWLCSEVQCQTATSLSGPWFTVVWVSGQRACAELAFTVKKTNEPQRFWRIVILR